MKIFLSNLRLIISSMCLNSNSTYFDCNATAAILSNGVNTLLQGLTDIFFGVILIPLLCYYCYLTFHILQIKRRKMKYLMISFTLLLLTFILIKIFLFFDFSLFCTSDSIYSLFYYIPINLISIVIFMFDYIMCKGLLDSCQLDENQDENNNEARTSLKKNINIIFIFKLPLLILFVLYFLVGYLFLDFHRNKSSISYRIFFGWTILYTFLYCFFIINTLSLIESILKKKSIISRTIHNQIVIIKIIMIIHATYRCFYYISDSFIPEILGKQSFTIKIKNECFYKGCIWIMLIYFANFLFLELDIYTIFGLFISQFIYIPNDEEEAESKEILYSKENARISKSTNYYFNPENIPINASIVFKG